MSAELKRLRSRVAELEQLVRWMAQTVHQAHHQDGVDGRRTWQECSRGFCSSARRGLGPLPAPTSGDEDEVG